MDHHDLYYVESSAKEPLSALIGRLLWFVVGPVVLLVLTAEIIISGRGWLTWDDYVFFATVALMVLARWVEVRTGYGRTSQGCHATPVHFRRYALRLVPWAVLVWTTANVVGNHLLRML